MNMHMVGSSELFAFLRVRGMPYRLAHHEPARTMEDVHIVEALLDGVVCKNVLLTDQRGRFFLVMTRPERRLELKRLGSKVCERRLTFASHADLDRLLGVCAGAVSCLALINDHDRLVSLQAHPRDGPNARCCLRVW
ncbi:YbaK/EbsC family protein [Pseudomonas fulva]|uniref:YbaK/EbsC family protein n=2 Tax=Pseudomonas fulva TaxID=47880 RepID=UPI0009DE65D6